MTGFHFRQFGQRLGLRAALYALILSFASASWSSDGARPQLKALRCARNLTPGSTNGPNGVDANLVLESFKTQLNEMVLQNVFNTSDIEKAINEPDPISYLITLAKPKLRPSLDFKPSQISHNLVY